ncbi:Z1 domain-containing protein [Microbacterium sp. YY-03]|uniref:Z1 domain-containing protein n=1 Tax=Microbacterium sp. YY-03 TaxID=3421636 RepID=UPI003D17A300
MAKAVDAGYRLIIVLTGTIELLRGQTQRRLDMELIGEENILDGADPTDPSSIRDIDYISTNDADWKNGKFLRHGKDVHSLPEVPSIKRLTTVDKDYRKLRLGRDALDFRRTGELVDIGKPVYAPENIFSVDARIAVMKKNSASLKNLLHDLKNIRADGREIPALIIDDEADQASVNTINPRSKAELAREVKSRTAINKLIAELLKELPRAQYVGYTATPFANVFVSPEDSEDLFPKDFLVSLVPSAQYMGGKYFHDLDGVDDVDKGDPGRSNEAAFVRGLHADGHQDPQAEDKEILAAIDAFVLSGAIKKWREASNEGYEYRHHTMLVHESVQNAAQSELATKFRNVWSTAGYSSPSGLARLRALYTDDFFRVSTSRREWLDLPMPESFDDLKPYIGDTIDAITADSDPVVIVNGSSESDYNAMDFQLRPYWRIMVGGAKLSRGFTVEGLTISYFRRKAGSADTMMQMGRWFGYRPGYGDLVRLYIARDVADSRGKTYDLYDAFTSIIQDEESFRDQLHKFAEIKEDGRPVIRPIHVPPLVFQQFPWLKPTSPNKMYNAELAFEGDGGVVKDFNTHADRANGKVNADNWKAIRPLLAGLSEECSFRGVHDTQFRGRYTLASSDDVLAALRAFSLLQPDQLNPTIKMIENATAEGTLVDWAIIVPELDSTYEHLLDGHKITVMERQRRQGRPGFAGSERRHRAALEEISQLKDRVTPAGPTAEMLSTPTRGALLLTFTFDPELRDDERAEGRVAKARLLRANRPSTLVAEDLATLFSLAMPYESAPRGRLGFRVRRGGAEAETPIVDVG